MENAIQNVFKDLYTSSIAGQSSFIYYFTNLTYQIAKILDS